MNIINALKNIFSIKKVDDENKLTAEITDKHFYPFETFYLNRKGVNFIKNIILQKKTIKISYGLNTAGLGIFVLDFQNGALISARRYYKNELYDEYSFEAYKFNKMLLYLFNIRIPFDFERLITTILLSAEKVNRKLYPIHSPFQKDIAYQMLYYTNSNNQNSLISTITQVDSFYNKENNNYTASCNFIDKTFKIYSSCGILRGSLIFNDKKFTESAIFYDFLGNEFFSITYKYDIVNIQPHESDINISASIKLFDGSTYNINNGNMTINFNITLNDKHINYLNEISNNQFIDMKCFSGKYSITFNSKGFIDKSSIILDDGSIINEYYTSTLFALPNVFYRIIGIRDITANLRY